MPAPHGDANSACIALGSNLGDRRAHLQRALTLIGQIPSTHVEAFSDFIETPALRVGEVDPGGPYLNAVARVSTALLPRDLLEHLARIESLCGRDRTGSATTPPPPRGSARTLDLDLLLHGSTILHEPGLTIPHPRLQERLFVLIPLAQVAPDAIVPGRGTVASLLAALRAAGTVIAMVLATLIAEPIARAGKPSAQPASPPPSSTAPIAVDPAIPIQQLAQAYGTGPTAERLVITLRWPGRPTRDADVLIRLDPGTTKGPTPRPEALAVEMGVLRLFASAGVLQITTTENPEVFYQAEFDPATPLSPELIDSLARPLPLLPLAALRAAGDPKTFTRAPYLPSLAWRDARLNPRDGLFTLTAPPPAPHHAPASPAGDFTLTIDDASGRLRTLSGPLVRAEPAATAATPDHPRFEIACTPVAPGDPARWRVDTKDRRRVATIGDLRRSGDIAVGQRFPVDRFRVTTASSAAPTEERAITDLFPAGCSHAALVFSRPAPPAARAHSDNPAPDSRAGLGIPEHTRALLAAFDALALNAHAPSFIASLGVVVPEPGPAPDGPRAYFVPARPVERLAPGVPVAIILIDRTLTIRAIIPVDPDDQPESLAALLRERVSTPAVPMRPVP